MKISEMTNDQAADALIRLAVPFGNLCEDKKVVEMIDAYNKKGNIPVIQSIGKFLPQIVLFLLKDHKDDLYEIVGALTFHTQEQVAELNFVETVNVIKASYDEVLKSFFTSSVDQMKNSVEK